MADYFSQFSTTLALHTKENVAKALEIATFSLHEDELKYLFNVEEHNDTSIWLYANDDFDMENVEEFIKELCTAVTLKGKWGFTYSYSCSKPRLDEFGGGAVVFDLATGDTVAYTSNHEWLMNQITPEVTP